MSLFNQQLRKHMFVGLSFFLSLFYILIFFNTFYMGTYDHWFGFLCSTYRHWSVSAHQIQWCSHLIIICLPFDMFLTQIWKIKSMGQQFELQFIQFGTATIVPWHITFVSEWEKSSSISKMTLSGPNFHSKLPFDVFRISSVFWKFVFR